MTLDDVIMHYGVLIVLYCGYTVSGRG